MKRLAILALVTLSAWLVLALPAGLWLEAPPAVANVQVSLAAAGICLVPASLTLVLIDLLRKRTPVEKIVAALAAPFIRMILAGGSGVARYYECPLIHDHGFPFITWVVVFYLVTLAVETRLLYINTTVSATTELSNR